MPSRLVERRDVSLQRFNEDGLGFALPIVVSNATELANINPNKFASCFVLDLQRQVANLYAFVAEPPENATGIALSEVMQQTLGQADPLQLGVWLPFRLSSTQINYDETSQILTLETS